jgi:hypothetical protein
MLSATWKMLKQTVLAFINDEALSRGASIAFYIVTSIAPVLLIVIAVAGLAFGREAAQNAIIGQLSDLMGQQTAEVIQTAVASAASKSSGILATIVGIVVLLVTASGVFGEMQAALNAIWKAKPKGTTVSRLIRARTASLGLVPQAQPDRDHSQGNPSRSGAAARSRAGCGVIMEDDVLELYHSINSVCAQKARIALEEKGQKAIDHIMTLRGDQYEPAYLKLNPNGVVPTLVHDGVRPFKNLAPDPWLKVQTLLKAA